MTSTPAMIYAKYDLTRNAIAQLPDLAAAAKNVGAVRVSLIASTAEASALASAAELRVSNDAHFVAIKAPSLEGTEIWLVEASQQAAFETSVGFEKTSLPLITLKSQNLVNVEVKSPVSAEILHVSLTASKDPHHRTGVFLSRSTFSASSPLADDEILSQLAESGHLIACPNSTDVDSAGRPREGIN